MIARLAIASIALGLLLFTGGVFLSEGYSGKRGFLESLSKMKVRLTADTQFGQFSQISRSDPADGPLLEFEGKQIQLPYEMAEAQQIRVVEALDAQKLAVLPPDRRYFFEGWTTQPGATIRLGSLLAFASALVIGGAAVLVGVRLSAQVTRREPISRTETSTSRIAEESGGKEQSTASEVRAPPVQRSRLRFALHLWGGVCLKAAADVSKLFDAIGSGRGDIESARAAAMAAGLITVLLMLAGYYLSHKLVSALDKAPLAPHVRKTVLVLLPIAYFAGAILLGGTAALLAGKG